MPISRREALQRAGTGVGILGLAGTLQSAGLLGSTAQAATLRSMPPTHLRPRAKRVIFLMMNGGPSHVDTFDPKSALSKYAGQMPTGKLYKKAGAGYMPSPFKFRPHGVGGVVMSELFPYLSQHANDLCVLRGMHTDVPNHEPGLLVMTSGNQQPTRPSIGSWASYGLGTENANLPSFVVLCPGLPVVGPQLWSSGFLPGEHQGTSVDTNETSVDALIANLRHPRLNRSQQREQLALLQKLNHLHAERRQRDAALEAQIQAFELAFNMQREASDAFDIARESQTTREMYGDTTFGRSCLLARRLTERGVRFVQVFYVSKKNKQPWDTHKDNDGRHRVLCRDSDRATAALIADLKRRGLLEDTLIVWGGEFGRTPYAQDNGTGRDHNPDGFTIFLAGGGVKSGFSYGQTDEYGHHAVQEKVHMHDLHATLLHLLGMDHERLTFLHDGRPFRLTDVHGEVQHALFA